MIVIGMQTFAFSPKFFAGSNATYIVPGNLNGMTGIFKTHTKKIPGTCRKENDI